MKLGAKLSLGDFTFPLPPRDSLDFAMDRSIAKLDFPGGPPVYQDMGMNEKTIDFSGCLDGDNALDVNDQIETLWWGGKELQLTYGDIKKTVRIQRYAPKIKRSDRIDYTIHLLVVFPEDLLLDYSNVGGQTFMSDATVIAADTTSPPADIPGELIKALDGTYTVKAGDTLWDIAAAVYGDGSKWEILAQGNGITDEYSLQVGQVIKVPSSANIPKSEQTSLEIASQALGPYGRGEILTSYSGGR